ncbi:DUF7415 domain-containing protein [Vibrio parahaemolyticus]|uniref:DUF7415 domain-containing protein n=1 Tax=Vibrio parahaemolyticus TaxID=670 RepID=UPI001F1D6AB6|nr:hypothetical protein [Vibrio parahaemolyticus]MCG0011788.1 hypothetical protein [Vibrio parahaemolyticus]MDL1997203.1 hypothetical protein [Vibrio parahaemolyticus]
MKAINWNQMSELGLIERINREMLHQLGLAISRNAETGASYGVFVADDGAFAYSDNFKSRVLSDEELQNKLAEIQPISISEMAQPYIDNWVPARDQLPQHDENDKHTSVLVDVFGDGERWPDCYYCFLEEEWIWNDTGEPVSINVTYWKAITHPNVEQ